MKYLQNWLATFCAVAALALPIQGMAADAAPKASDEVVLDVSSNPILHDRTTDDIIYGDSKAPVSIVEYASLSCPHCADFYKNVFPQLKEKYIDSGVANLVFRHFPLNEAALRAAMLVDCVEPARKQTFVKALFESQSEWAYGKDFLSKLGSVAKVGGMPEADFNTCVGTQDREDALLMNQLKAARELKISSTPSFFVNGVRISEPTLAAFGDAIERAKLNTGNTPSTTAVPAPAAVVTTPAEAAKEAKK